ncbi:small nuclear RNA (snRNA) U1 [Trypanosoma equiperdum]|uniref:Uncharacterized protein n=2 Tax=Trypanozoon TaxID=39700 RepID=Q57WZ0_TRYB2|nr:hypothetical protein, conserved [Trypanosoma brucei brucei TREU927]AAX69878.1 hypothetical protein, conserved [Trypanosoma brucei]AAZ10144.1 hypothetical protein, conserved [Trypanosoma brucei brucei TREU927]SCU69946.1 small nuclear RNA (snRNA) U1 [Trypanosoma equiperdum]
MTYCPITRKELERYLPNFDPLLDPQIGEWVLVTPERRFAILGPLLQFVQEHAIKPIYPFLDNSEPSSAPVTTFNFCKEDSPKTLGDPSKVFPTLSEVWRRYRRRRFHISGMDEDGIGEEEENDDTILYLNPRALLLTPCAPAVFGGSDFIEGLDREGERVVFVNWKTGETRTDSGVLKPAPIPAWAEDVAEKAAMEWESWKKCVIPPSSTRE